MRRTCALFFVFLACLAPALGLADTEVLSSYAVYPKSTAQMDRIAAKFEVHHRLANGGFEVIVPVSRAKELLALDPKAKLVETDIHSELKRLATRGQLAGYRNFKQVEEQMRAWAAQYPEITKFDTYGQSKEGQPLFVLKISDNANQSEGEPGIMITAATHGDELITVEVVLGLMKKLLEGYQSDERLKKMVDTKELFFIPVVSPDGFTRQARHANGIDPNRDYPHPGNENKRSNPAIKAIMDFFGNHNIVASMDYHASGGMIMTPWAYTRKKIEGPKGEMYRSVGRRMAQAAGYRFGSVPELLYTAPGSSADYYFWKKQSLSFGIEVAQTKIPPASQIPHHIEKNTESTWILIESF